MDVDPTIYPANDHTNIESKYENNSICFLKYYIVGTFLWVQNLVFWCQ